MNLAYRFPILFWNCACLITDSGGSEEFDEEEEWVEPEPDEEVVDIYELEDQDEYEYVDAPDRKTKVKKKRVKNNNYGKIASAIGKMKSSGVKITPPDINRSTYTFSPDVENNLIRYGLSGITRVNDDTIKTIISNRPYKDFGDFLEKVPLTKPVMVNLIKAGAFDAFDDREIIMSSYIEQIAETKKRITMQNLGMLIERKLLPEEKFDFEIRVFNFNKYLKKLKKGNNIYLDEIALMFYERHFDMDKVSFTDDNEPFLDATTWKNIYDDAIKEFRPYIQEHSKELLDALNEDIFNETWEKYATGSLSKWEMDSVSYYSHEHELERINHARHGWANYFKMSQEPEVTKTYETRDGKIIPLYEIKRIAGTVLDRDKNKKTITLLTVNGVVTVKMYGPMFANYDRQISVKGAGGKKEIKEKSWFSRGNKIIVSGIRQGDSFIAKKYKNTEWHLIELITKINDDGTFESVGKRYGEEED